MKQVNGLGLLMTVLALNTAAATNQQVVANRLALKYNGSPCIGAAYIKNVSSVPLRSPAKLKRERGILYPQLIKQFAHDANKQGYTYKYNYYNNRIWIKIHQPKTHQTKFMILSLYPSYNQHVMCMLQ